MGELATDKRYSLIHCSSSRGLAYLNTCACRRGGRFHFGLHAIHTRSVSFTLWKRGEKERGREGLT